MTLRIGYKASAEQFNPRELVEFAVEAEQVGLDSVMISDHFQPWRHTGGHAPFSMAWLADEETNTYGGVYIWVDRGAMEAYLRSDIFNAVAADPNLVDITSRDFDALEGPSRTTFALANALT